VRQQPKRAFQIRFFGGAALWLEGLSKVAFGFHVVLQTQVHSSSLCPGIWCSRAFLMFSTLAIEFIDPKTACST
jgi:hypothetical protein